MEQQIHNQCGSEEQEVGTKVAVLSTQFWGGRVKAT